MLSMYRTADCATIRPQRSLVHHVQILLVLGVAFAPLQLSAAELDPRAIDLVFRQVDKPDSPGCALAIVRDGRIVYKRGYGMSDLEHGVPITPASVFYVGSISKQFTAMTAALLIQQGKLSLDDDIRK